MLALIGAMLITASSITAASVPHEPALTVDYLVMEDIVPVAGPGGYVLRGEAVLNVGSKTLMYDLAGRKSNGDLSFAAPRAAVNKKWNWYSTGMFTTVTWF